MKTFIITSLLIFGLAAQNYSKPITDIYSLKDPIIEEEAYVDDIPFNTWQIAIDAMIDGDELKPAEEPYVDDIPFDTRAVASQYIIGKINEKSGEANVNDIPFDTEKVMYKELASRLTEYYKDEQNTCDLPLNDFSICNDNQGEQFFMMIKIQAQ